MPFLEFFLEPPIAAEENGNGPHAMRPRRAALFGLSLALLLAVVFCFVHPAAFETNDDPGILSFAYGLHGEYDPHLIFVNILLGRMLVALIRLFPNVVWYTIFEIALVTLSFAVLFYLFFQRFGMRNVWFPLSFIIFCYAFEYYSLLQFTRAAGIASLAGMLLLFHGAAESDRWRSIICGFLLTVFGSLWRFKAMGMVLLPLFGVGLYHLVPLLKKREWRMLVRLVCVFAVTLVCCFALNLYDASVYKNDPVWREYTEFNALRSELTDRGFPDYEDNEELYRSLDISPADLRMFKSWDFDDPEIFTKDSLQKLVDAKEKTSFEGGALKEYLLLLLSRGQEYYYLFCGLLPALALCVLSRKRSSVFLVVYEAAVFALLELYLMLVGRITPDYILPRLEVSLLLSVTVILFLFGSDFRRELKSWVSLALIAATVLGCGWYVHHFRNSNDPTLARQEKQLIADLHEDRDRLYMISTISVGDVAGIWETREFGLHDNIEYLGGWRTRSPARQFVYDRFGVSNPFRDVVDNPGICFVTTTDRGLNMQISYIRRHYAPEAGAYCVRTEAGHYAIYRVLTQPPRPDPESAVTDPERVAFSLDAVRRTENGAKLSGMIWLKGANSCDSMLFLGQGSPDGGMRFRLIPLQSRSDDPGRPEGRFVYFDVFASDWKEGEALALYLTTADGTYRVPLEAAIDAAA